MIEFKQAAWEWARGLITTEEFYAMHAQLPPGCELTVDDLDQDELARARHMLSAS